MTKFLILLCCLTVSGYQARAQTAPAVESADAVIERLAKELPNPAHQAQFARLMNLVKDLRGQECSPEFRRIFEIKAAPTADCLDGQALVQWFGRRVAHLEVGKFGTNQAQMKTHVVQLEVDYFGPDYGGGSWNDWREISSIFHEARHLDGYPTHFNQACPAGLKFDDTYPIDPYCLGGDLVPFGPRGTQAILFMNIHRFCTNCSEDLKALAQKEAVQQLSNVLTNEGRQILIRDSFQP